MTYRRLIFANKQFYHIFNKSVGNAPIFVRKNDLKRAFSLINFYRFKPQISYSHFQRLNEEVKRIKEKLIFTSSPLVEIHAFALMPNHFHFLLRQLQDDGIPLFISNMQNSFAKYFNTLYERRGSLFCEMFKAVFIESEEQLVHVSRYIHLNPVTSYMINKEELDSYIYTSFSSYTRNQNLGFVTTDVILERFKDGGRYREFVYDQVDYQRKLEQIKHLTFEKP